MNLLNKLIILAGIFVLTVSSTSIQKLDYTKGMQNNICKTLRDNVLVYFIFVDTKTTSPWTEFDIQSTIDSMEVAIQWLEKQATVENIPLNIISDYYIGTEFTPVYKNLPLPTVKESVESPSLKKGLTEINKWADNIARTVGADMEMTTKDGIPEIKNPRNKERLAAHLRDDKQVENVAIIYLVNNYYRDDISVTVNHLDNSDVEFAIVSYKYPSVIAQNILNLFGASDLYKSIYRRNEKKIKLCEEYFPNDIMQDVYGKEIYGLKIGPLTKFLIGWDNTLKQNYKPLLTDNFVNF